MLGSNYLAGYVSSGNSTTTLLGIEATFVGVSELTPHHGAFVIVSSDVSGTLYIDLGVDDGVYEKTYTYSVVAGVPQTQTFLKGSRYCRVRYVNGSTAQGSFSLQTEFGDFRSSPHSGSEVIFPTTDSIVTRPSHYQYEAALGFRADDSTWNKFGYNDDIDSAATEVIAEFGGVFSPLAAASTLSIVSTDAADASGGTGATGIIVYGVDANWDQQIEVVTMNGTTPVVTTSTWLGINRLSVYAAGTGQANAGRITATAVTGSAIQGSMPIGEGTSQQCIFFVRGSHTALMDFLLLNAEKVSGGGSPRVMFKCWVYSSVSNARYEVFRHLIDTSVNNDLILNPNQPFVVGEKSAFWIEADTDTNNTHASARFSLVESYSG